MERRDNHTHTLYSDGADTPEAMVLAAIRAGLTALAVTDHSYTAFDTSYCIPADKIDGYRRELAALREKYRDRITLLCGIEQDYYSDAPTDGYEQIVGSVHYLHIGSEYIPVDENAATLTDAAARLCGGDIYAIIEEYYRTVADVVRKTGATVIGHFDLIAKYNEKAPFFDEGHPRYIAAWKAAADALLATGVPFEINTGAISRGYRTTPYPAPEIRQYIAQHGGAFVLSSDSHSADNIAYAFPEYEQ